MNFKKLLFFGITMSMTVSSFAGDLISVSSDDGKGARIVNIHSASGKASDSESAYNLLIGEDANLKDDGRKWCDLEAGDSWVIFSLSDYYLIDRIVFRDVELKEQTFGNVPEYWVYVSTTGTADSDWTEVLHKTDQAKVGTKDESFVATKARYVKFVAKKGTKDNEPGGEADNAIRIYGFDIYGTYDGVVDRGGIISVGKIVVDYFDKIAGNSRETPANVVDGNFSNEPWSFFKAGDDLPNKWIVLDLGEAKNVKKFVLHDAEDWTSGYKVYAATELPEIDNDLYRSEDEIRNEGWKLIVDETFEKEKEKKEAVLSEAVSARYLKYEVHTNQTYGITRLKEFEVYEDGYSSIDENLDFSQKAIVYPNVIRQGELINISNGGLLVVYSIQGAVVDRRTVEEGESISTDKLSSGCYFVQVLNEKGTKSAKLIVK